MQKLVTAENTSKCVEYKCVEYTSKCVEYTSKGFTCVACNFLMIVGKRKEVICDPLVAPVIEQMMIGLIIVFKPVLPDVQ